MLRISAALVLLFAIPVSFIEVVSPNLFSTATGRSAGLYVNPNMACAAILLCLIFVVDLARPTAKSLLVAAVSIAAVFATFSRMGMIFATMLGLTYAVTPRLERGGIGAGRRTALLLGLGVLAAVMVAWVAANVQLSDDARMRLRSFLTADVSDESASGRIERAVTSAKLVAERPLGWGVGAVERKELGPHNTYLYLAVDYGIPGALLFVAIMGMGFLRGLRAGWRRASCAMAVVALLAFTSLFDHYVANSLYLAVGFAALMSGALIGPRPPPRGAAAPAPSR
jgi:O-antigen ligase